MQPFHKYDLGEIWNAHNNQSWFSQINDPVDNHPSGSNTADEQNDFWKRRSCIDLIFVLSSMIRNRKAKGLSTYIAYIDFEKAFDHIDRKWTYY